MFAKKYVACLHVHVIALCTSRGSHNISQMICSYGIPNSNKKIMISRVPANTKFLQVPFSFSKYRTLARILMGRYLLFKFALSFFLPRTYKRLVSLNRASRDSPGILKRFYSLLLSLCTFMHSMPRSRDADKIAKNWSLTEWHFRHLETTVLGKNLLSYHTVYNGIS